MRCQDHDLETTEGRLAALDAAAQIVAGIKDRGLRQLYAVSLDRWLGMMDERLRAGPGSGPCGRRPGARVRAGHRARRRGAGRPAAELRAGRSGSAQRGERRQDADGQPTGQHQLGPLRSGRPGRRTSSAQALKLAVQRPGAVRARSSMSCRRRCFTVPAHAAVCELIAEQRRRRPSARAAREWAERLRAAAPNDQARGVRDQAGRRAARASRRDWRARRPVRRRACSRGSRNWP